MRSRGFVVVIFNECCTFDSNVIIEYGQDNVAQWNYYHSAIKTYYHIHSYLFLCCQSKHQSVHYV